MATENKLVSKAASSPCRLFKSANTEKSEDKQKDPSVVDKSPMVETMKCVQTIPMDSWYVPKKVMEKFSYPIIEKISIMFPEYSMLLARKNTNQYDALRSINNLLYKCYGLSKPKWMWTKKPKPKETIDYFKDEVEASIKKRADEGIIQDYAGFKKMCGLLYDEDIIGGYSEFNKYDIESVKTAIKMYPERMLDELAEYKDILDSETTESDERKIDLPDEY